MKYSYAVALGIALLAPITESLSIERRDKPRVVSLPVGPLPNAFVQPVESEDNGLSKRSAGTLETILNNHVSHMLIACPDQVSLY